MLCQYHGIRLSGNHGPVAQVRCQCEDEILSAIAGYNADKGVVCSDRVHDCPLHKAVGVYLLKIDRRLGL